VTFGPSRPQIFCTAKRQDNISKQPGSDLGCIRLALEQINPDAMHDFWIALNWPDTQGNRAQGCYRRSQRQPMSETVMNMNKGRGNHIK
jgi:hypothetical protein